jgi:hypothetical protein
MQLPLSRPASLAAISAAIHRIKVAKKHKPDDKSLEISNKILLAWRYRLKEQARRDKGGRNKGRSRAIKVCWKSTAEK